MTEIPLTALSPQIQEQVAKARRVLNQGEIHYAAAICLSVLNRSPECLAVRELLRQAQYQQRGSVSKSSCLTDCLGFWQLIRARCYLRLNPRRALAVLEAYLMRYPYALVAHHLMGRAASALGLWQTAVLAYQTIGRLKPDDTAHLLPLAQAHLKADDPSAAITIGERLIEREPDNCAASELLQRASVVLSIRRG